MGLLPRVRIVVDKPDLDIAPEVAAMMKRKREKKDQEPRYFTTKERLFIFVILGATVLIGIFFWFGGGGKVPENSSPLRQGFDPLNSEARGQASSEPIIPHNQEDSESFGLGWFTEKIRIEK